MIYGMWGPSMLYIEKMENGITIWRTFQACYLTRMALLFFILSRIIEKTRTCNTNKIYTSWEEFRPYLDMFVFQKEINSKLLSSRSEEIIRHDTLLACEQYTN